MLFADVDSRNVSRVREVRPKIPPKPEKGSPAAKKGKFDGVLMSGSAPVPKAKVEIVEGSGMSIVVKQSTISDDQGKFVFQGVEPGNYQLRAEGMWKNRMRKAPPASFKMPDPARTVPVTLNLQ